MKIYERLVQKCRGGGGGCGGEGDLLLLSLVVEKEGLTSGASRKLSWGGRRRCCGMAIRGRGGRRNRRHPTPNGGVASADAPPY